ncbi:MAG: hypothetical protein WD826_08800 [Actinomycetota bacterium]
MSLSPQHRRVLGGVIATSVAVSAAIAFLGGIGSRTSSDSGSPLRGERVVVVTMPGVTWADVSAANMPTLDRLVDGGASAALAPRAAINRPSPVRGYMTLGAGNRAIAANDAPAAQWAYMAGEATTLGPQALTVLDGLGDDVRQGEIAHVGVPQLSLRQASEFHGTKIGALGEALARAKVERALVSAADHDVLPDAEGSRGAPALTIVDRDGVVARGEIRGMVEPDAKQPFGVRTSVEHIIGEVADKLDDRPTAAKVLFVEPGETLRADEYAPHSFPDRAKDHLIASLERTDRILGGIVDLLSDDDLLLVVTPSSATDDPQEHLVPVVAWGASTQPGLLVSATTRRAGIVTLTDIAPTILNAMGVERPSEMSGRPMRAIADGEVGRPFVHDELDASSVFREEFVPSVFYGFVAMFVVLSILVGLVFLAGVPLGGPLVGMCYLVLAVPLATFVMSFIPLWRLGVGPAHIALWAVALVIAGAGWVVPGPRWVGAVPLLLATVTFVAVDLITGGHLLVNGIFGNSVLAAGRFYGIPNTGSALFFGAGVLGLAGIADLRGTPRARRVLTAGLITVLVLIGAPPLGADVGGLIMGVAAVGVILVVVQGSRVSPRRVVLALVAAGVITLLVTFVDSLRPVAEQTHFGRFGEALFGSEGDALTVISRKASQSWSSLAFSRFTYVVPLGIAALGVLLRRPRDGSRSVLAGHSHVRAALAGLMVAGVVGFLVNDSGVAVPAMLLAQAVPLVVLIGLGTTLPLRRGS